jgi:GNAT superfamily N-acetyltransferase
MRIAACVHFVTTLSRVSGALVIVERVEPNGVVRRIEAHEGPRLREVRLAALADSPDAFTSTYEHESGLDDAAWAERAAASASDQGGQATFVLDDGRSLLGLVTCLPLGGDPARLDLVGMWVAPSARRHAGGRRLVEAVLDWAATTGASAVDLWVMRSNGGAQAFYERLGFTPTDEVDVAPDDPCRDELRLTRTVVQR